MPAEAYHADPCAEPSLSSSIAWQAVRCSSSSSGRVFLTDDGRLYADNKRQAGGQIRSAWGGACHRAWLPGEMKEWKCPDRKVTLRRFAPDLTPHGLRHTWATWHYAVWRDLQRLREECGWERAEQVAGYAHVSPEGLAPAVREWWGLAQSGAFLVQSTSVESPALPQVFDSNGAAGED